MFHIFEHGLLSYRLFDLSLGFDIERVSFKSVHFPLAFNFCVRLHLAELA